jgi:hypothetical protein
LSIYFTLPEPSFKGLSYLFEKWPLGCADAMYSMMQ